MVSTLFPRWVSATFHNHDRFTAAGACAACKDKLFGEWWEFPREQVGLTLVKDPCPWSLILSEL